ncbi:hypothetical protein ACFOY4_02505 [Actinomadura syzygii]|nr:hypothetical protein [Actinomadura syzygii]
MRALDVSNDLRERADHLFIFVVLGSLAAGLFALCMNVWRVYGEISEQ